MNLGDPGKLHNEVIEFLWSNYKHELIELSDDLPALVNFMVDKVEYKYKVDVPDSKLIQETVYLDIYNRRNFNSNNPRFSHLTLEEIELMQKSFDHSESYLRDEIEFKDLQKHIESTKLKLLNDGYPNQSLLIGSLDILEYSSLLWNGIYKDFQLEKGKSNSILNKDDGCIDETAQADAIAYTDPEICGSLDTGRTECTAIFSGLYLMGCIMQ